MNPKDRPVRKKRRDVPHDARVFRLALIGGLPAVLATVGLLVIYDAVAGPAVHASAEKKGG